MNVKYIKEYKRNEYTDREFFTLEKEYEVLADYRHRTSKQEIPDNGFVVVDDLGEQRMVFINDGFMLSESEVEKTFVFSYWFEIQVYKVGDIMAINK